MPLQPMQCHLGRTMYLVPFSMGPIGGPLSKNGIELTDSAYVAASMRVMTRVNSSVLDCIKDQVGFPIINFFEFLCRIARW